MKRACDSLHAAGHQAATLSTDPGTRAARFYRRTGWEAIGYSAKGELIFRKSL